MTTCRTCGAAQARVRELETALAKCAKWSRDHSTPLDIRDDQDCCPECVARAALAKAKEMGK